MKEKSKSTPFLTINTPLNGYQYLFYMQLMGKLGILQIVALKITSSPPTPISIVPNYYQFIFVFKIIFIKACILLYFMLFKISILCFKISLENIHKPFILHICLIIYHFICPTQSNIISSMPFFYLILLIYSDLYKLVSFAYNFDLIPALSIENRRALVT